MQISCFVRKIDELGRIVLPIELRQALNLQEKDSLEIFLKDDGIFIKKSQPCCAFCNSTHSLKPFSGKNICEKCLQKLKEDSF